MNYSLGVDIGSINSKLAVVDENGMAVHLETVKITSNARDAVNFLVDSASKRISLSGITGAGICGSGKSVVPSEFHWSEYSSSLATASGVLANHPDARTIIQIGGQSSLIIGLADGLKKPWRIASNPLCAAGTGRFLEQQAYRLGIGMEDFAELALKCTEKPPRIAARCSVFAKSDLIHLQQKGVPVEAMLYALCESIARMVVSLQKGIFEEPVFFVGGVAANKALVKALTEAVSSRNGRQVQVTVPEDYLYVGAVGSALLARGNGARIGVLPDAGSSQRSLELPKLEKVNVGTPPDPPPVSGNCVGYLGVDVGSTSTKAVILDESGKKILAKNYLMTAGRPVDAVKQVFQNLLLVGADKVTIGGVGVTGSGRYLIGSLIGADLIKNEITAQTRAAADIDAEADIIEIGGQDSKLVIKRNQVVVDYQMNKACAAGTGSFIDELAEMLGVSVKNGQFADLAFAAPHSIDLGTRCAAFMSQAVASAQQEGTPLEVVTASLANSIARNYLSKVVGSRKLGNRVILTGAVFYNQAVVAAFQDQLKGKSLTVAEHREVTGAMGAALLAKEGMAGRASRFKSFKTVIGADCALSTFTCKSCDNNCAITRMLVPDEKPTFYGSRCDLFDSTLSQTKKETAFDGRERLLLAEYKEKSGSGPTVGVPRALLVHDYAPLLIGFLNALGAKVALSSRTTKEIIEQSVELGYTDSCFPVKLLHGHVAALKDVDFVLYPSAIRLGLKDGDENQKYACPLVQASPYIVRQALGLGERVLIPTLDYSCGESSVAKSLADVAGKMGFGRGKAAAAARAGLEAQRRFERQRVEQGDELLRKLNETGGLGVVLLSRSYMAQDAGANLGIAEKLAQLGVTPVPLDYLALDSVDAKKYSDRPYWSYEGKLIAGAAIAAADKRLYGLALTNFGCGPNSFILKILEDIMGGKPLGQLEIDEHAAEAGLVTRLEAFVDTIKGHAASPRQESQRQYVYRGTSTFASSDRTVVLPRMANFVEAVGAAMEAFGVKVHILPEPDERNLLYSNQYTSGTECLPYRVTLGDFMRFYYEDGHGLKDAEALMAGSYGPCRFGKYVTEQMRVLKEIGFDFPIRSTISNDAYSDFHLGADFERLAWKGMVAIDYLEKLLWRTRPYEKEKGRADLLFDEYKSKVAGHIRKKEDLSLTLNKATAQFKSLINRDLPRRPLVGINGEIYLRSNRFSNGDLVRVCEDSGLEVVVSSIGEWIKYISHRNVEDAIQYHRYKGVVTGYIRKIVQEGDERSVAAHFRELLGDGEPSIKDTLIASGRYLSSKCGSEAVLSVGTGIEWLESPHFAGVISVMPHGCMPGGIVAAMSEKLSGAYQKPWISLTFDGFLETNNRTRINEFAELLKFCSARSNRAAR